MVYIYKKKAGNIPRYYLRASERKGQRIIIKDIAYLGSSIVDVKKKLNQLTEYREEIRKAYKTINRVLESNYYLEKVEKLRKDEYLEKFQKEIEACKLHYQSIFSKKDSRTKKEILKEFAIDLAYNTTSIEGNTISLKEARKLLEEGLTPINKSLREIYDVQNTERVFLALEGMSITHTTIIDLHKELMKNVDERVGYRSEDVAVFRSRFDSTPGIYVKTDMDILLKWYKEHKTKLHPLVLATLFHHKFEKIHPFMDGNGRTGRILVNLILLKNNYPPIIVENKLRSEYLDALGFADKADLNSIDVKYYKKLVEFFAKEYIGLYWNYFL